MPQLCSRHVGTELTNTNGVLFSPPSFVPEHFVLKMLRVSSMDGQC